jgi:hypothetical protein
VCENEYDLLGLIDPDGTEPEPTAADEGLATGPHDAPDLAALVEAVREHLEGDVMDATEGRVRFHARVAANVLRTVEREVARGPALAAAHRARLDALGVADEAALAAAIRSGAADGDRRILETVWQTVVDKLAVANPGYMRSDRSSAP